MEVELFARHTHDDVEDAELARRRVPIMTQRARQAACSREEPVSATMRPMRVKMKPSPPVTFLLIFVGLRNNGVSATCRR